jgi:hypothetical protein
LIKIYKSKENLNIIKRFRFWLLNNATDLLRVRSNTFNSYNKTKKLNLWNIKLVFAKFIKQVVLPELSKYLTDIIIIFFNVLGVDKDII